MATPREQAMAGPGRWRRVHAAARLAAHRAGAALRDLGLPIPAAAKVVYHPDYVTAAREAGARRAFDGRRPARILEQLLRAGVLAEAQIATPELCARELLELVHTPTYLDEVSVPGRLAELLFMPRDALRDNHLWQVFLRQTGGTVLAAERSLLEGVPHFNLGGGFHHAQRDRAEGFCAINDVAVAVKRLQQRGLARRVLVIDLDFHPGNGTSLIFEDDEDVFTLSIHRQTWNRVERKRNNLDVELPGGTADERYLQTLRATLTEVLGRFTPEMAIYLAGADVHDEDTFGDFDLSDDGLLDRDLHVWQTLHEAGIPFCVLLAGGYSPFAWAVAYNFIFSALTGERIQPAYRPSNIQAHYRRVQARITPAELRTGDGPLTTESLDEVLSSHSGSALYMGYYTTEGLRVALEHYGFLDLFRERGFEEPLLSTNATDPDRQFVRLHDRRPDPDHLLVELVTRFRTLITPPAAVAEGMAESYRMVSIEWLTMQDPRASFTLDRQRFPGQQRPGLGLGRWMVELLRLMTERLDADGLMNIPQHYHNALLYSRQMLCFHAVDQGFLEALRRDLGEVALIEASAAMDDGRLRRVETGERLSWEGKSQVMPIKPRLTTYFTRPSYIRAVSEARERYHYELVGSPPDRLTS